MNASQAMKEEAGFAYQQLELALEGVTEQLSWAQIELAPEAYLHTNGTIIGIVQHIAICKFIYGSVGFRSTEIRWRDGFDRLEQIGTSWEASKAYLAESQAYWMDCWSSLPDDELDANRPRFSGEMWPTWKLIAMVTHHDAWHGGQIAVLASALVPTIHPPDMKFDEERKYVMDLPTW